VKKGRGAETGTPPESQGAIEIKTRSSSKEKRGFGGEKRLMVKTETPKTIVTKCQGARGGKKVQKKRGFLGEKSSHIPRRQRQGIIGPEKMGEKPERKGGERAQ